MLRKAEIRPWKEIWKMRPRLRNTLSLSRDSPQPSQESAREYSTMVNTSCSAIVNSSKRTRSTVPSEETTVAGSSVAGAGCGKASITRVSGIKSTSSANRMLVPPDDMSMVSPLMGRTSGSLVSAEVRLP